MFEEDSYCLKSSQLSSNFAEKSEPSWIPVLPIPSPTEATETKARFKSPNVPHFLGLECIGFEYSIISGSKGDYNTSLTLSLLQQQKGYYDCSLKLSLVLFRRLIFDLMQTMLNMIMIVVSSTN